jgi:shikimate dehydrogenase
MSPKKAYVIGNRVKKSLSPIIFNYWLSKYKINAEYKYREINKKNFYTSIGGVLKEEGLCGLNITIPFKESIISSLDEIDSQSKEIGAVNCVSIKNKKIFGSNTDWIGYSEALKEKTKKEDREDKEVMLIGYGGAAKAVLYSLLRFEYKKIHIFNRTFQKLNSITNKKIKVHKISEINNFIKSSNLIINTTPVNVFNKLNTTKDLSSNTTISDIVYNPLQTNFLKYFNNPKNKIYGISMLIYQAIPCFEKWFDIKPTVDEGLLKITEEHITK